MCVPPKKVVQQLDHHFYFSVFCHDRNLTETFGEMINADITNFTSVSRFQVFVNWEKLEIPLTLGIVPMIPQLESLFPLFLRANIERHIFLISSSSSIPFENYKKVINSDDFKENICVIFFEMSENEPNTISRDEVAQFCQENCIKFIDNFSSDNAYKVFSSLVENYDRTYFQETHVYEACIIG